MLHKNFPVDKPIQMVLILLKQLTKLAPNETVEKHPFDYINYT
jgi:hypothetical protein